MNRLFLHTARYSRCQLYVHGLCEYIPTDQKVRSSNLLGRTKGNPVTDGVFLMSKDSQRRRYFSSSENAGRRVDGFAGLFWTLWSVVGVAGLIVV